MRVSGLYAVTPETSDTAGLCHRAALALEGGARLLQYRSKSADAALRREQAGALASLCRSHGALFIVNDDIGLAREVEADGVHLGREDAAAQAARAALGPRGLVGVSCYDSLQRAIEARSAGADYVAFGSMFPSPTKPHAVRAPLALLGAARERVGLPVVAIGGITEDNAAALIAAGADAVAVVSALFDAPDVRAAARRFAALFSAAQV